MAILNFGRSVNRRCGWRRNGEGLLEDSLLEKSLRRLLREIRRKSALSLWVSILMRSPLSVEWWWHKTLDVSCGSYFEMFLYWNYWKSETFQFAGLLATMHYSNGCWNDMHLKHTNYFGRRTLRGELCAQLSSLRESLDVWWIYVWKLSMLVRRL